MLIKDHSTGVIRIDKSPTQIRYYDTGKVKIGCAYIPKPMPMTNESILIQGALLGYRPAAVVSIVDIVYVATLAITVTILFSMLCK